MGHGLAGVFQRHNQLQRMSDNAAVTDCYDINCLERLVIWSDGIREPEAGWKVP